MIIRLPSFVVKMATVLLGISFLGHAKMSNPKSVRDSTGNSKRSHTTKKKARKSLMEDRCLEHLRSHQSEALRLDPKRRFTGHLKVTTIFNETPLWKNRHVCNGVGSQLCRHKHHRPNKHQAKVNVEDVISNVIYNAFSWPMTIYYFLYYFLFAVFEWFLTKLDMLLDSIIVFSVHDYVGMYSEALEEDEYSEAPNVDDGGGCPCSHCKFMSDLRHEQFLDLKQRVYKYRPCHNVKASTMYGPLAVFSSVQGILCLVGVWVLFFASPATAMDADDYESG
jgi:hypothetical protein